LIWTLCFCSFCDAKAEVRIDLEGFVAKLKREVPRDEGSSDGYRDIRVIWKRKKEKKGRIYQQYSV
jgi:hypothetical protein